MDAKLVIVTGKGKQKVFPIPSNVSVIGRRKNCDFRVPLESVSRRHCQIFFEEGTLKVRDLGSRNGTYLNGKKIEEHPVGPGDVLQIGPVKFAFQIDGQPSDPAKVLMTSKQSAGRDTAVLPAADGRPTQDADAEGVDGLDDLNLDDLDDLGDLEDL